MVSVATLEVMAFFETVAIDRHLQEHRAGPFVLGAGDREVDVVVDLVLLDRPVHRDAAFQKFVKEAVCLPHAAVLVESGVVSGSYRYPSG